MRFSFIPIALIFLTAACSATQESFVRQTAAKSTGVLWIDQQYTTSALELAVIEAELGVRGETHSGSRYLGKRTMAAYGRRLYSRAINSNSELDCSDFPSSAAAQKFFLAQGGPASDPHNLDGDGDGLACEWGAKLRQVSRKAKSYQSRRIRSYSSKCYVGPRGGTYTITASGNKNYSGC